MTAYTPMKIVGPTTGLVQNREEFILPNDAYPVLENAFVWRERIKRKQGFQILGRLQRNLTAQSLGNTSMGVTTYTFTTIFTSITPPVGAGEINKTLVPGTLVITIGAPDTASFTDNGMGGFTVTGAGVSAGSSVNYSTGVVTIVLSAAAGGGAISAALSYYPGLPVMGLRQRDLNSTNNQLTIAFDTKYAYIFSGGSWTEYIPGTTWTGDDSDFFWSTNYWVDNANNKLFWVTNFSGTSGDPIRYSNGVTWTNFAPQIDGTPTYLEQCLCILPYRGRLLVFNTLEGGSLASAVAYPQRIRWSALGNPIPNGAYQPWRDDITATGRGQGGMIDIPVNESIVSVGVVRDNLVIYCSRSTWQLRYTGRSIDPFQLERVNPELGAEGTFSTVQFDTSFVGIGDKGIVECDSFKSTRIDIKIPNLVFNFSDNTEGSETNTGTERIQGVRDFVNRLAFWTFVTQENVNGYMAIYPNRRLLYNYENDSWAIFTDSLTALGTFISSGGRTWAKTNTPWNECNFPWISRQGSTPDIIGGNQQGFVFYLDAQVSNDPSLSITAITGGSSPLVITSPNHNLTSGQVIQITGITSTGYSSLNGGIYGVTIIDANTFTLSTYNPDDFEFSLRVFLATAVYNGGGIIAVRDNFLIQSKKFNYIDEGESIQMGYVDLLMAATTAGAITLNVFWDYNEDEPINAPPALNDASNFFNSTIPTTGPNGETSGDKYWQRVYCPTRANFLTLVYTLSNAQLNGQEQQSQVQIDAQILWQRRGGRMRIGTQ